MVEPTTKSATVITKIADNDTTAFLQKLMNPAFTMRLVLVNIPMRVFSHDEPRSANYQHRMFAKFQEIRMPALLNHYAKIDKLVNDVNIPLAK
ncbi:MAG: hypothetical protein UY04_C0036G0007 [Parcubacteria group bacterium GW2011_GWA2_47_7]|nr:MAG: hypothetical protein UY04_C0036G0007 [Parcubacteria group bacterium GW2011_GWA2_47_7]